MVSLCMVLICTFGALAVDNGNARQVRRQAQATADAAALSALMDLNGTPSAVNEEKAIDRVKQYAFVNQGIATTAWQGCDSDKSVPIGWVAPDDIGPYGYANSNRCILIDQNNTQIRITRLPAVAVKTIFGGVVGVQSIPVSAKATATMQPGTVTQCALCVLGGGTPYDGGNGDLTVSGDTSAGVAINGDASTRNNGSLTILSGGGLSLYESGSASGNFSPSPVSYPGAFADPLASLATPSITGALQTGCAGPGVYASIPTNCSLTPGVYVITGNTHISGSDYIDASNGVTFYMACAKNDGTARSCNAGENGADLVCTGNATLSVTAPTWGTTKGIAFFFDRNNDASLDCRGNGTAAITGTIYGASAGLVMRGNGNCNLNSLVVIESVSFDGNPSSCAITYRSGQNVRVPYGPPSLIS